MRKGTRTGSKRFIQMPSSAEIIGTSYTLERIQELIAELASSELRVSMDAISEFMDNRTAISEAALDSKEITDAEVVQAFSQAVQRDPDPVIRRLEAAGDKGKLEFLANAEYLPKEIRAEAETAADRLSSASGASQTFQEIAERGSETLEGQGTADIDLQSLTSSLRSENREEKAEAAVRFLASYSEVIEAAAETPLLTVTEVKGLLAEAICDCPAEIVETLKERGMAAELELLAEIPLSGEGARELARAAASGITGRAHPEGSPAAKPPAWQARAKIPQQQKMSEERMERLMEDLESPEAQVASEAVVECLKSYDAVVEFLSGNPMATVTKFSDRLFSAFASHFEIVFKMLREREERRIVEFLILSSKSPESVRKRAISLRRMMEHPEDERQ